MKYPTARHTNSSHPSNGGDAYILLSVSVDVFSAFRSSAADQTPHNSPQALDAHRTPKSIADFASSVLKKRLWNRLT
jgi:hypothetical protein